VYRVRLHGDNPAREAVVKFSQQYSIDAHRFCASLNFAPQVYEHMHLEAGWQCIVMEWIEVEPWTPTLPPDVLPVYKQKVGDIVKVMHENNFVHGDLRTNNVLWSRQEDQSIRVVVVDFDFAGRVNEATYPPDLNPDISWPPLARSFGKVFKADDLMFIDKVRLLLLSAYMP
jgi:serine/threonine protein kinase